MANNNFKIADRIFSSRLILGTGKYSSFEIMKQAHEASGTQMVTVAVRRIDLNAPPGESLLDYIDTKKIALLPNTAACFTAEDAVKTARLARQALDTRWIKLEVIGDEKTLFPDVPATLEAAKTLLQEGFIVLPYITDDPVACKRLEEMGCPAVMPLAAPIGSGLGIRNPYNLRIILEQAKVPIIVDAGVGCASDAAVAMELGCSALLMNTAVAGAKDPVKMAGAMRDAVRAGRACFEAGRIPQKLYANASSPIEGVIGEKL
jgi:thiazole synthase